jgi:hypothetical protein
MRSTPARLVALALAASATGLVAGCGGSGATSTADTAARQAAAAPTLPAWTCEDFGSDDQIAIRFTNQSSTQVTLRAPKPADCAPWSGDKTPGQVNAEGAIAPGSARTVTMDYDGLADETGTTQRTPLGIEVYLATGKSSWVGAMPNLQFIRSTNEKGRYVWRKINLFVPAKKPGPEVGRYECSTTIRLPTAGGVAHEGAFVCAGDLVLGSKPAAIFTVRDAPKR